MHKIFVVRVIQIWMICHHTIFTYLINSPGFILIEVCYPGFPSRRGCMSQNSISPIKRRKIPMNCNLRQYICIVYIASQTAHSEIINVSQNTRNRLLQDEFSIYPIIFQINSFVAKTRSGNWWIQSKYFM